MVASLFGPKLKPFSAVIIALPIAQAFRSLKPGGARSNPGGGVPFLFIFNFPIFKN